MFLKKASLNMLEDLIKKHNAEIEMRLNTQLNTSVTPHDLLAIEAIKEALKASKNHNYPVGALIVDRDYKILARNHNHVFDPYFNSMGHAEMTTLNEFESKYPEIDYKGISLITSIEPCVMCYSRLILSKIDTIAFIADDPRHGAVEFSKNFPKSYDVFRQSKTFSRFECVREISHIASDLFFKHPLWDTETYQTHK